MVIYPGGLWYTGVTMKDVPEIFEKSVLNDEPVDRLLASEKTWDDLGKLKSAEE